MAFSTQKRFFHVPFMNETVGFQCRNPCVKMKTYASTIDDRSWNTDIDQRSKFVEDLVMCNTVAVSSNDEFSKGRKRRSRSAGEIFGTDSVIVNATKYIDDINVAVGNQKENRHPPSGSFDVSARNKKFDEDFIKDFCNQVQSLSAKGSLDKTSADKACTMAKDFLHTYQILSAENGNLRRLCEKAHQKTDKKFGKEDEEKLMAITRERNELREKIKNLHELQKKIAELQKRGAKAGETMGRMSQDLAKQGGYIDDLECKCHQLQQHYDSKIQNLTADKEMLECQVYALKEELFSTRCTLHKLECVQRENSFLLNEVQKLECALTDYDIQYKSLMRVIEELGCSAGIAQSDCCDGIEDLANLTAVVVCEIKKRMEENGYCGGDSAMVENLKTDCEKVCSDAINKLRALMEQNEKLRDLNLRLITENKDLAGKLSEHGVKITTLADNLDKLDQDFLTTTRTTNEIGKNLNQSVSLVKDIGLYQAKNNQLLESTMAADGELLDNLKRRLLEEQQKNAMCQAEKDLLRKMADDAGVKIDEALIKKQVQATIPAAGGIGVIDTTGGGPGAGAGVAGKSPGATGAGPGGAVTVPGSAGAGPGGAGTGSGGAGSGAGGAGAGPGGSGAGPGGAGAGPGVAGAGPGGAGAGPGGAGTGPSGAGKGPSGAGAGPGGAIAGPGGAGASPGGAGSGPGGAGTGPGGTSAGPGGAGKGPGAGAAGSPDAGAAGKGAGSAGRGSKAGTTGGPGKGTGAGADSGSAAGAGPDGAALGAGAAGAAGRGPGATGAGPGKAGTGPGSAGAGPGKAGAGPGGAGAGPGGAGAGPGNAGTGPGGAGAGPGGAGAGAGGARAGPGAAGRGPGAAGAGAAAGAAAGGGLGAGTGGGPGAGAAGRGQGAGAAGRGPGAGAAGRGQGAAGAAGKGPGAAGAGGAGSPTKAEGAGAGPGAGRRPGAADAGAADAGTAVAGAAGANAAGAGAAGAGAAGAGAAGAGAVGAGAAAAERGPDTAGAAGRGPGAAGRGAAASGAGGTGEAGGGQGAGAARGPGAGAAGRGRGAARASEASTSAGGGSPGAGKRSRARKDGEASTSARGESGKGGSGSGRKGRRTGHPSRSKQEGTEGGGTQSRRSDRSKSKHEFDPSERRKCVCQTCPVKKVPVCDLGYNKLFIHETRCVRKKRLEGGEHHELKENEIHEELSEQPQQLKDESPKKSYKNFITLYSLYLADQLEQGIDMEYALQQVLDALIDACGFCFCKDLIPKGKFYIICHKILHRGFECVTFKELIFMHEKIVKTAENLKPGHMVGFIKNRYLSENTGKSTCCRCKEELCCSESGETLSKKINELEVDMLSAKQFLHSLKAIPPMLDATINEKSIESTKEIKKPCSLYSPKKELDLNHSVKTQKIQDFSISQYKNQDLKNLRDSLRRFSELL